jgi:hypothetical protein
VIEWSPLLEGSDVGQAVAKSPGRRWRHGGDLLPLLRTVHERSRLAAALRRLPGSEAVVAHWQDGATGYVLTDLSAPPGGDAVGVALCGAEDGSGEVLLLGLAVQSGSLDAWHRLVVGVANALRANGARRLVAPVEPSGDPPVAVLLAAGFRLPDEGSDEHVRLVLDL